MFSRFIDMFDWVSCKHENLIGIYGDAVYFMPHYRRLLCMDCGHSVDGPVSLANKPKTDEISPSDDPNTLF